MQSFGRRRRPRRLPAAHPLPLLAVVVASALLATSAFVTHRLWPLTDRAAGAIDAPGLTAPGPGGPGGAPKVELVAGPPAGRPKRIRARAAIVVDRTSGRVLWQKGAHRRLPVASLTKLMTALVALDRTPDASFQVTPAMTGVPGYTLGLRAGDRVTERRMLAGALIASANDAANALAVHHSGSVARFVRRMNAEARTLGLRDTHYSNPSGIYDTGNGSSAWDQATLSLRVLEQPLLRRMVGSKAYTASPTASYISRNTLLWDYRGAIGIKTGQTTAAGNCIAAAAKRKGRSIVVVLLHVEGDEFRTAGRLLDWGFRHGG
ncbi:MAG TPA: serine hydrolase [Gaiellales bacterium]|nr:serine hydrolase [Gaiellales bacterium]